MSRATAAVPPGLRRSNRRAVRAGRLLRRQAQEESSVNEDEEEDTENESDASEGLSGLHSGPSEGLPDVQREAELRGELLARRRRPLGPVRWPLGPERWPLGPERPLNLSGEERGEARARGEFQLGAEAY